MMASPAADCYDIFAGRSLLLAERLAAGPVEECQQRLEFTEVRTPKERIGRAVPGWGGPRPDAFSSHSRLFVRFLVVIKEHISVKWIGHCGIF